MTDLYNKKVLKIVIAQTCQTIGWHSIQTSPMDIMIDILDKYLKELTRLCHNNAELCSRTEPNLNDLALAFRSMDVNINDIEEYINYVQPITCPIAVPQFPLKKNTNLNFLKPGRKEVLTRPVFVYEYLPPIFPEKEDSEHETSDIKPINELSEIHPTDNFNLSTNDEQECNDNKPNVHKLDISIDSIKNNPDSESSEKNQKEYIMEGESARVQGNSGAEDSKDNVELHNKRKSSFEKPLTETAVPKSSIEQPAWQVMDVTSSTIDNSIRDISSVLMTSSGFISPCRVGKLPDKKPPQLKERRSITPPYQMPEPAKMIASKNAQHLNKSNLAKRSNDSDPQLDSAMLQFTGGKIPKTQDMNERLKKMKNKILVSTHQPNQLKKSLKQRKRNKLVNKNLANSVQVHKLLKQLHNMDGKGGQFRLKNPAKLTALQIKKKEKKTKKLLQKELNMEKQSSKKMQEVIKQMMQNQEQNQMLQDIKMEQMVKPMDQTKMPKMFNATQKQIDFLEKQLQKGRNSYLNKLDVFKKNFKQKLGMMEDPKARNQLASTNPNLIQLPMGTTITTTANMLNRNIPNMDQQYSVDQDGRILFIKDDEEQRKDQKSLNDPKLSIDRNANVLAASQPNSLQMIPQLNEKISQQKLQKKLKRKARQMMMEEQPLNLTCMDPNMGQMANPNLFLKNLQDKNLELEWLAKAFEKDKSKAMQYNMHNFPMGNPADLEKLIKKERKNKKLKNSGNMNPIEMSQKRNLQNYPEQQQSMYAAAAVPNPESISSNSDKVMHKMDTIIKSQANSGTAFNKSLQRKISSPQQAAQQHQQDLQQQNAAIVLNAATNNPFLAAVSDMDGIFKQFPYPAFPTGPGLIPQALFGPSGSFIPPVKHLNLPQASAANYKLATNPVFNRFNFPTLPTMPTNIGRDIYRQPESSLSDQQGGKYCNIAPLLPDSVIPVQVPGNSDYGSQSHYSMEANEKVKNILPVEGEQTQPIEISDDENKKSDEEQAADKFPGRKTMLPNHPNSKNWGNVINVDSQTQNIQQTEDGAVQHSLNTSQTPISEAFRILQRNDQGPMEKQPMDASHVKDPSAVTQKAKHRKEHHHQHHHKKDKYKDKISPPSNLGSSEIHQKPRKSKKDKKTKSKEKLEKKLREKGEKGNIRMNLGTEADDGTPRKLKLDKLQKKLQKKEKRKEKQQQKELLQKREQQQEAISKLPGNIIEPKLPFADNFALPIKTSFESPNENVNLQSPQLLGEKGRELSPELARISPLVTRPQKLQPQTTKLKAKLPENDPMSRKAQTTSQGTSQPPIIISPQQQQQQQQQQLGLGILSSESSSSSCSGSTIRGPGRPKGSGNKSLEVRANTELAKPSSTSSTIALPKKPNEQSDEINVVWICPACGRVDDGTPMIGCDGCDAWYHWVCVGIQVPPDENENWYCRVCIAKKQESHEIDKKKKKKNKKNKSLNIKVNLNQN